MHTSVGCTSDCWVGKAAQNTDFLIAEGAAAYVLFLKNQFSDGTLIAFLPPESVPGTMSQAGQGRTASQDIS